MKIANLLDLYELERQIARQMQQYDLDDVLLGLRNVPEETRPFMVAGAALFAVRFAQPPIAFKSNRQPLEWKHLKAIFKLVNDYLLADPVSFEPPVVTEYHSSTSIPLLLRMSGNQFLYEDDFWGQYGRSLKLFRDIPKKVDLLPKTKKFDIHNKFFDLTKVDLTDFIVVGFILHAAVLKNAAFVGGYFEKARSQGITLPNDKVIRTVIDQFAADIMQIREKYELYKQSDRNYAAYDFNPLRIYPIIRPWTKTATTDWKEDRFIVPLPQLILSRMSDGIYAQMFQAYKSEFAEYFGLLFENYVGEILQNSFSASNIISEGEVRKAYKSKKGKAPDWIVLEDDSAVLIECKATGLSQKALATGDMTAIDFSVERLIGGLVQLHEFKEACQKRTSGLERLHGYSNLQLLVATYEPFYIINSDLFKEKINERLEVRLKPKGINVSDWEILSVEELEKLQPHFAAGLALNEILSNLKTQPFNGVLNDCHSRTGKIYQDCFLHQMDAEIYGKLGIPLTL